MQASRRDRKGRRQAAVGSSALYFDAQGFSEPFILEDTVRGVRKVGWFDSPIRHEGNDGCDIDLSFRFLEARLPG